MRVIPDFKIHKHLPTVHSQQSIKGHVQSPHFLLQSKACINPLVVRFGSIQLDILEQWNSSNILLLTVLFGAGVLTFNRALPSRIVDDQRK